MEKENEIQHGTVETYAQDMAKVLENDQAGGLIKKIIHGEEEHEALKRNLSPESKKNRFFMLISLVLVFSALVILSFFILAEDINTVGVEEQFAPLIFSDKSSFIEVKDFTKDQIAQTVLNAVTNTEVKPGGVEGMYLSYDKKVVGLQQFTVLIKGSFAPEYLFVNDNFLLGAVNNTSNPLSPSGEFFMLLKVRSIADVFDALRAWEKKMFFDLHGFFGLQISSETNYLLTASFEDTIIENKNARIRYDRDRNIVMMYIFADDTSVLITNTENAAHEIMLRLASSRVEK